MKLLTTKEFSEATGIPVGTLRPWAMSGKLIPVQRGTANGQSAFYSEEQISEALAMYKPRKKKADFATSELAPMNDDEPAQNTPPADVMNTAADTPADDTSTADTDADVTALVEEVVTLADRADRIRKLQADVQRGIIEIGHELIAAKKEIGHGGWGEWLKTQFDWTQQTANRFMRVAERFGKLNNVVQFQPSTLQAMLALPADTEQEFIDEQAAAGRPVETQSAREVKRNVDEFKKRRQQPVELDNPADDDEPRSETFAVGDKNVDVVATDDDNDVTTDAKKLPPIAYCKNTSTEYYTPAEYVNAARAVLGNIDLDPASSELANETVKAEKFFTADVDGLQYQWCGRVFMNPPFANGMIEKFVDKFAAEFDSGNITAAVVLVDNATETRWFYSLVERAAGICFTRGRINFNRNGEPNPSNHTRGQAFLYFGDTPDKFFATFAKFGWCSKPLLSL